MKIRYDVNDGYVGKERPQYVRIDDADLEGLSRDEVEELIEEAVQQHFAETVMAFWDRDILDRMTFPVPPKGSK